MLIRIQDIIFKKGKIMKEVRRVLRQKDLGQIKKKCEFRMSLTKEVIDTQFIKFKNNHLGLKLSHKL